MIYTPEFGVFDDSDTFHDLGCRDLDGLFFPLHEMSGHPKPAQYDFFGMDFPNVPPYPDHAPVDYVSPPYKTLASDQHALTALPADSGFDLLDHPSFGRSLQYSGSAVSSLDGSGPLTAVPTKEELGHGTKQPPRMTLGASRKRKASSTPPNEQVPAVKKPVIAQFHIQDPNGDLYDLSAEASPYSSLVPTPAAGPVHHLSHSTRGSPRVFGHGYSTSNVSQVSLAAPSPCSPVVSPAFTTANTEHSPGAPMTPVQKPASVASPLAGSNPKLVRTSTIPQQLSPGVAPNPGGHGPLSCFNPYAMYPPNTKARLQLSGDLDAVGLDWNDEELEQARKLVVFTRSQSGSVIDAKFKVVPPQEWNRADSTVNCIWWKEKGEAFVTSVDTIALLEQLVAVRFTVEEKNRIRRNLEGFRPQTVSKGKSDSEEFFKTIMGFTAPKPRNIEKDVKVFPWKVLSQALNKIISKYSASYSSTASALPNAPATFFTPVEATADCRFPHSPGHEHPHSAPPTSGPDLESLLIPGRMPVAVDQVPDLHVRVPPYLPTYAIPSSYQLQFQAGPLAYSPLEVGGPTPNMVQPWGYDGFANAVQSPMGPASAPPTAYPRALMGSAGLGYSSPYTSLQR